MIVTRAASDRSPNDHAGFKSHSTAEIHARRGWAAPKETTDAPAGSLTGCLTDRKSSDIKGLASARTALFAGRQPRVRVFYGSSLGIRETAIDGLPEAEANFRDLHHRLIAIF